MRHLILSCFILALAAGDLKASEGFAPNDVSILLNAPLSVDEAAEASLPLPEPLFSTELAGKAGALVGALGSVTDTGANNRVFQIGTEIFSAAGRQTWHVASIRIDPGAPGLSPAFAPFGRQLQIRLVVQPVLNAETAPRVTDKALHVVYTFGRPAPTEACPLRVVASSADVAAFDAALEDLRGIKETLAAEGVVTDGAPLGVHPAFDRAETAELLVDELQRFLGEHLSEARLSALSIAGIPANAPEPWIFFAMRTTRDATGAVTGLTPVPSPAIAQPGLETEPRFAQALSFIGSFPEGRVVPAGLGRNRLPVDCLANLMPIPTPMASDGVSTTTLFDSATTSEDVAEIAAVINDATRSHFFNTDCLSCHTETRRALDLADDPQATAVEIAAAEGIAVGALPQNPGGNEVFGRWNVRAFGWFPGFQNPRGTRAQATVVRRTKHETDEVLACLNEGDWRDVARPCIGIDRAETLDQGWSEGIRQAFYHTSQGGDLMPLAYFLSLETADGTQLFADPANLEKYGLLPSGDGAAGLNPYNLPVGLAAAGEGMEKRVSLNCAACHVADVEVGDRRLRVDGAPAALDFDAFLADLSTALRDTVQFADLRAKPTAPSPRFLRFLSRVGVFNAGSKVPVPPETLAPQAVAFAQNFAGRAALRRPLHPSGPGRVDALTQIVNSVAVKDLGIPTNHVTPAAPTSYPPLWLTSRLEFVQYNLAVADPLNRNLGQALGVFGQTTLKGPRSDLFKSNVDIIGLEDFERWSSDLSSPEWPAGAFGAIDAALAGGGRDLFAAHCEGCHNAPNYRSTSASANLLGDQFIAVTAKLARVVGTDPVYTQALTERWVNVGPLAQMPRPVMLGDDGLTGAAITGAIETHLAGAGLDDTVLEGLEQDLLACIKAGGGAACPHLPEAQTEPIFGSPILPAVAVLGPVVQQTTLRKLREQGLSRQEIAAKLRLRPRDHPDCLGENGQPAAAPCGYQTPLAGMGLKAGPLEAVWTTGPYLHNGSVRTIYELLSPPDERATEFWVGSRKVDPDHLGFVDERTEGAVRFDTTIPGNGNGGHVFWETPFSDEERLAIIEYLKDPRLFPLPADR